MIKVGDAVKYLNDVGSGVIVEIIDKHTALVRNEDGFELPVLLKELVLEAGNYGAQDAEPDPVILPKITNEGAIQEVPEVDQTIDEELIFALLPSENSSDFESYLINSSSYYLKYVITNEKEGEQVIFSQGELEPGIKIMLKSYHPAQLTDEEYFRIQIILFNHGPHIHMKPIDMLIQFQASEIYTSAKREENDYFHEKAILFSLYNWKQAKESKMEIDGEALKKAMLTKGDEKKVVREKLPTGPEEVDLHIHELVDDHSNMDNAEMLEIQLSRFRTALESAIIHKTRRIVFIHGVGNGKLKYELRKILDSEYKKVRYQDASFKEYGFGATMVLI